MERVQLTVTNVEKDHEIEITFEGPDEAEAAAALGALIRTDFDGRI